MAVPRHTEAVLGALWGAVVHRAPAVRAAAATLWGAAVGGVPDAALGARLVPALVTLASDQDVRVKAATLTPLATTLTATTAPEVVDKVWLQLETLADDSSVCDQKEFQLALAHTCTHLAHTAHPRLIHQFLLPRMCHIATGGGPGSSGGPGVGEEVGAALLEAYSALTCCLLPDHVIAHLVLPPLMQLQKWLGGSSFNHMETITDLIREYSLRTESAAAAVPERQDNPKEMERERETNKQTNKH
ncbi:RAB11-binding protein RELCH homolog isoform X3 [Scylla paramamosain]|uniref:RAB11-binding protein RELCH homolog isoform X3 n=1 Tax=Scylla paramamosain TaxID=85552 RepID=UPI0030829A9D